MVKQVSPHINEERYLQIAITLISDKGIGKMIITPPGTPQGCIAANASFTSADDIYNYLCALCPMACNNSSDVCDLSDMTNQLTLFK